MSAGQVGSQKINMLLINYKISCVNSTVKVINGKMLPRMTRGENKTTVVKVARK